MFYDLKDREGWKY